MKRTITLRYLFTLCVMTLISAFCGGNLASAEDFTFDSSLGTSRDAKSVSKGDVKIDMSKAYWYDNWSEVRAYGSSTITFTCTNASKVIKKIAFQYKSGTISTSTGGSFTTSNSVWESGDADYQTVIFTVAANYYKFTGVTVTLAEKSSAPGAVAPTFTISPDKTLDCLDSYTVEAVATDGSGNPLEGTIEYSISPESGDFTFDKETGVFKAGLSGGTYEVTATYSGTTGYNSATATCTITVDDPGVSSWKDYRMVTNKKQLLEGVQYVLATSYENSGWSYMMAMGNVSVAGYSLGQSVSSYALTNNGLSSSIDNLTGENSVLTFEIEKVGDYYALKTSNGYVKGYVGYYGYQYYIEYGTGCTEALAQWNIDFDANGNVIIRNVYDAEQSQALMYRVDVGNFENYSFSNYGTENYPYVQLYAKSAEMSISQDALGYGTYAVNFAYQMPEGVKGYAIESVKNGEDGEDAKLQKVEAYNAGDVVPALTPLLVYSEEAAAASKMFYPIVIYKDVEAYEGDNYLEYKRNGGMTASKKEVPVYYYKLTKKASDDPAEHKPLGFYWGADDGAAFSMNKSSSAYLALPQSLFARGLASALLFDEEGQATGIQLTPTTENNTQAIYNLQGVRVSGKLAKGIYIVNGKKVYVK